MKTVLLCLTLCLCTVVAAKNLTKAAPVTVQKTNLKNIENELFKPVNKAEFDLLNSTLNPIATATGINGLFYDNEPFSTTDNTSRYSEFSDKNSRPNDENSKRIIEDNSYSEISTASDSQQIFRQGMFYGFTLMLILGNLVCFFLFEEKTFLYYSFALAGTTLLLFYSDGLFGVLGFDELFANESLFLLFATGLTALFVSKYLVLEEYLPKLKWFSAVALFAASIILVFAMALENSVLSNVTNVLLFTVLCTYFLSGVLLFSKKNYAKFYVIASSIPLLFSFDYFLLRPMGIDFLATQGLHIKAAAIAEMLILTYAIMYRMQAIKEENALRQAELRIFLKRQEVLTTRQKTQKLVEDVYLENLIMHYDLDGLEIKLLQYISEGKENAKIARKLKSSEHEIEDMIKDLYDKLEISEQIQQDFRMVESQPDYIYN